jgi:hypothetical protein
MTDQFTLRTFPERMITPAGRLATLMALVEPFPIYCDCDCDCVVGYTEEGAITKEQFLELANMVTE